MSPVIPFHELPNEKIAKRKNRIVGSKFNKEQIIRLNSYSMMGIIISNIETKEKYVVRILNNVASHSR